MSMPISDGVRAVAPIVLAAMLVACGGDAEPDTPGDAPDAVAGQQVAEGTAENRIECAVSGQQFARDCTVEEARDDEGTLLTLRLPDGGFRRLRMTRDGRGVIAADGAEPARVTVLDPGRIEVAIGDVRYRLPATIGPVNQ